LRAAAGAVVGKALPSRRVVHACVVGAEALAETGLARVAELPQPRIPLRAGIVCSLEQFLVVRDLEDVPRGRGDGHHHLDLRVPRTRADFIRQLDGRWKLAVFFLLLEERHVICPSCLHCTGLAFAPYNKFFQRAINLALEWRALQPDARIGAALDQHRMLVARHRAHIARKHGQRGVPGPRPGGIACGKVRAWPRVLRGWCRCHGLRLSLGMCEARCGDRCSGECGLFQESAAAGCHYANQCKGCRPSDVRDDIAIRGSKSRRTQSTRLVSMAAKKAARGAERRTATGHQRAAAEPSTAPLDPAQFRARLMEWYRNAARKLPWRGSTDPYQIWVSEIMLQQTRVAAVIEHYNEFLRRFPTLVALALAEEPDVLAAWSGLGYYRRARMLHKAARFIVLERDGRLPATALELRTLPGIGDYTAAAIASIAFGEPVAVVDGNVERVILRLTGNAEDATATARAEVRDQ